MRLFGRGPSKEVLERAEKLGLLEGEVVYLEKHRHAESLRDLWDKEVKGVPLIVHRIRYYLRSMGIVRVSDLSKEFEVKEERVLSFLDSYLEKHGGVDFFVSAGWVLPLSEEKVLSVIVRLDDLFKQLQKDNASYSDLMGMVELLVSLKQYALKINNSLLLELCENKLREIKLRLQEVSMETFHSLSDAGEREEFLSLTKKLLHNPLLSATEKLEWQKFLAQVFQEFLRSNYPLDKKYSDLEDLEHDLKAVQQLITTYVDELGSVSAKSVESYYEALESKYNRLRDFNNVLREVSEGRDGSLEDAKHRLEDLRKEISQLPVTEEYVRILFSQLDDVENSLSEVYGLVDFHGILVSRREAQALEKIEKYIGTKLPLLTTTSFDYDTFGFYVEEQKVKHLGLYGGKLPAKLKEMPTEITHLKNLTKLTLASNQLKSLPENIGNLENLQELYISKNQLSSLPETIGNLKNLQKLWIYNNQLSSLPETIGNLNNLTYLSVWRNKLSSLPESLWGLKNLQVLHLGGNQLKSLPENIGNLKNLLYLSIHHNELNFLPETIGNLENLKELRVYNNQLSSLPESLINLGGLKKLYCSGNSFDKKAKELLRILKRKGVYVSCL